MQRPYKYRAFISYSHKDKAYASWLQHSIENYKIPHALLERYPHLPKDLKRTIFRDEEELAGANALTTVLQDALQNSESLIVICSAHAKSSSWVDEEICYFNDIDDSRNIICIIIKGDAKDILPHVLVENGAEPLAIDVNIGRKKSLMKVIASLLDVDFSDIWERETRETRKRVVLRGLVFTVLLLLSVYAYLQSTAIASNQKLEQINKQISNIEYRLKRKELSQDEVYQLREKLKRLEDTKKLKVDTLKWFGLLQTPVSKKAKKLYDHEGVDAALALLESSKSVMEDKNYAKKNMLRAKLYIEKDDYEAATLFYEKAVTIDDSYENVYDYVLFLMQEKHMAKATELLEKLKRYDLRQEQRANVLNRLGIVYRNLKRYEEAREAYVEALDLRKILANRNPKKFNLDLAWTYNNLGVLYKKMNELEDAQEVHFKAFALRKTLAEKNPKKYTFYVTCSMHNLGELYESMKKEDEAKRFFQSSIKIRRKLLSQNPKRYLPALASTLHELAKLYGKQGALDKAEILYKEALEYRQTLAKKNPQAYKSVWMKTMKGLKIIYMKRGKVVKAKNLEKKIKNAT